MAKAQSSGLGRFVSWGMVVLLAALAVGLYVYRAPISGYADVASAYSARVACSCRFVAGRSLKDCEKDKLAGMELVTLTDDASTKSVTARFPLIAAHTATHREGYGCVLESWED